MRRIDVRRNSMLARQLSWLVRRFCRKSITGDTDHDEQGTVQYRIQGSASWKPALNLVRVDDPGQQLAGSIMFIAPDTTGEGKVDLSAPPARAAHERQNRQVIRAGDARAVSA